MRRVILGAAAIAIAASQASAHAMLTQAVPGAGTTVGSAPKNLVLTYSEALEPALSGVSVSDAEGRDVTVGPVSIAGTQMNVALKPLSAGIYRVRWHALSVDTHRTQGSFRFTVKP